MSHQRLTEDDDLSSSSPAAPSAATEPNSTIDSSSPVPSSNSSSSPSATAVKKLNLQIRTLTGQNFPIVFDVVTGHETILDIKSKIESVYEIPVSFQRLIYAGRELVDNTLISSNRIEDGNTIHIVLRQNRPAQPSQQPTQIPEGFQVNVPVAAGGGGGGGGGGGADPQRIHDAWQLARAVKMFAVIDGIFLLLLSFSNWPFVVAVCMAMSGYYGAQHFRLRYVCLYVIYLLGSIGLRVYLMAKDANFVFTLVLVLGVLIQFYILNITMKFISLLRTITPQEHAELLSMRHPGLPV